MIPRTRILPTSLTERFQALAISAVLSLAMAILWPFNTALAATLPPVPKEVTDAVLGIVNDEDSYTPHIKSIPKRALHAVDVSHDGVSDWWVDFEAFGYPAWCGTGGCRQMVYVSRPDGHYRVEVDQQTREFGISQTPEGARLDIEVHGTACGGSGNVECRYAYAWDPVRERWSERRASNGSTLLYRGGFAIGRDEVDDAPEIVQDLNTRDRALCDAIGGKEDAYDSVSYSVPDLNGDGVREWVQGGLYCQDVADTLTHPVSLTRLLISQGGTYAEGWIVPIIDGEAEGFEIDISTNPAVLSTVEIDPLCDFGQLACPRHQYRWDADIKRLLPVNKAQPALDGPGFAK